MQDPGIERFLAAWPTYWGRRSLGLVLDDAYALRVAENPRYLMDFYARWQAALNAFPEPSTFRLMGTPELTPDVFAARAADSIGRPPAPRAGRYATIDPVLGGFSDAAGDYDTPTVPNAEGDHAGRRIVRGRQGIALSVAALATVWLPILSVPAAVLSLILTIQSDLLFRGRVGWRHRWPLVAAQGAAGIAIVLSLALAMVPVAPDPTEYTTQKEYVMSESTDQTFAGVVASRLREHWPDIAVTLVPQTEADAAGSPAGPPPIDTVRVQVADDVFLDAVAGEFTWSVRPMRVVAGKVVPAASAHAYGIGVTEADGPVAVADRVYEEVRYWWTKLHPDVVAALGGRSGA